MKHTILAAAGLALTTLSPALAEPTLFGNAVRMATVDGIRLGRVQTQSFRQYKSKKSYFGAFYVEPGTDHVFWTRNFHSLDLAKAAAKKGCDVVSEGGNCKLYAILFPRGVDPNAKGLAGFSQVAGKNFKNRYPREQKTGKYGAFALNGAHGYGVSYGWKSANEASAAALAYCDVASTKALAPLGIEVRKWAKRRNLDKCKVIDVHAPK